jgi:hypothetical protein
MLLYEFHLRYLLTHLLIYRLAQWAMIGENQDFYLFLYVNLNKQSEN